MILTLSEDGKSMAIKRTNPKGSIESKVEFDKKDVKTKNMRKQDVTLKWSKFENGVFSVCAKNPTGTITSTRQVDKDGTLLWENNFVHDKDEKKNCVCVFTYARKK